MRTAMTYPWYGVTAMGPCCAGLASRGAQDAGDVAGGHEQHQSSRDRYPELARVGAARPAADV